jgi:hypothetical protein
VELEKGDSQCNPHESKFVNIDLSDVFHKLITNSIASGTLLAIGIITVRFISKEDTALYVLGIITIIFSLLLLTLNIVSSEKVIIKSNEEQVKNGIRKKWHILPIAGLIIGAVSALGTYAITFVVIHEQYKIFWIKNLDSKKSGDTQDTGYTIKPDRQ